MTHPAWPAIGRAGLFLPHSPSHPMRHPFLTLLLALILSAFACRAAEKEAILMVHYGSTFDDTRAKTIDVVDSIVAATFPDMRVERAFTSRVVIRRLAERGINIPNPVEALLRLAADGYTRVYVQPTCVIDGIEMNTIRDDVAAMLPFFKEIRVGNPLLYSIDDCSRVANILAERNAAAAGKGSAVILVGHGTYTPATAIYSQMDYIFHSLGHTNFHVSTIEGYPNYDTTLRRLRQGKTRRATLIPFLFVAGDHARNDINDEWRERLEADGIQASAIIEGMGEIPAIRQLYIDHLRDIINR